MRRYTPFILVCLLIPLIYVIWVYTKGPDETLEHEYGNNPKSDQSSENTPASPRPAPPRPVAFPKEIVLLPVASSATALHSSDTTAEDDLSLIHSLLRSHRRALGSNPVGLNDEITSALTGKNRKGAASLAKDHPAISENGELLDRWGTPYRFHAYSGKLLEVSSAGPDKKFFTSDDIKLRE